MSAPPTRRGLLDLPSEVRNTIYKTLFPSAVESIDSYHLPGSGRTGCYTNLVPRSAQLLRVCHTIHDEANPVFLDQTLVSFTRTSNFLKCLQTNTHCEYHTYPRRIRHLAIDISPELLQSSNKFPLDFIDISALSLLDLQTATLTFWRHGWYRQDIMVHELAWPCFDDARMMLMTIGSVLLMRTGVNCVKDESIEGTKVVIKATTRVAAQNTDLSDVSLDRVVPFIALLTKSRETSGWSRSATAVKLFCKKGSMSSMPRVCSEQGDLSHRSTEGILK